MLRILLNNHHLAESRSHSIKAWVEQWMEWCNSSMCGWLRLASHQCISIILSVLADVVYYCRIRIILPWILHPPPLIMRTKNYYYSDQPYTSRISGGRDRIPRIHDVQCWGRRGQEDGGLLPAATARLHPRQLQVGEGERHGPVPGVWSSARWQGRHALSEPSPSPQHRLTQLFIWIFVQPASSCYSDWDLSALQSLQSEQILPS